LGYTHYWTQKRPATDEEWGNICRSFKRLVKATKPPIQFESDQARPIQVDPEAIRFNGIDEDGHETVLVEREDLGSQFCKTERKLYDRWVIALLMLMEYEAPGCWNISSDGDREAEWTQVLKWLNELGCDKCTIPPGVT
jgi:hypothetical protein